MPTVCSTSSLWRRSRLLCCRRYSNIFDAVEKGMLRESEWDIDLIRNFSVIAHVDHGKSTLSDALLQATGNINESQRRQGQVLDTLKVERERGITVKANTASMVFTDSRDPGNKSYLLNLIDTPGHIDFSYEVSRSLASCQGALLLVDSTQSIQAQTLANFNKAKSLGLVMIPVITKVDLPNAQVEETALALAASFSIDPDDAIITSAKRGIGISEVFRAIVDRLPSPRQLCDKPQGPFVARIVDSWFDTHRGVVCLIQVVRGTLEETQKIAMYASNMDVEETTERYAISQEEKGTHAYRQEHSVQELGILTPTPLRTGKLAAGQVGYVIAGFRSTRQARIGDTMFVPVDWQRSSEPIKPLPGYETAKPMLYASIYPVDTVQLEELMAAVDKLLLNDSSITVTRETSNSLGAGLRCGFLGFLHMEVFSQRLKDEFDIDIVMTTPSVPYVIERHQRGEVQRQTISCLSHWPASDDKFDVFEPTVEVTMVAPQQYYGPMVDIIKERRGSNIDVQYLDNGHCLITALLPWQEVVCDMHDAVKHASAGYASFNYTEGEYIQSDLIKVEIAVNGDSCDALSFIAHRSKAADQGRKIALKLKEVLSRQQFEIVIQAKIGAKILAKERIAPYRKDVLSKSGKTVGGGDITRKKKLLEKQKEGKKRSKMVGKVEIDQAAFWSVLQR